MSATLPPVDPWAKHVRAKINERRRSPRCSHKRRAQHLYALRIMRNVHNH